MNRWAFGHGLPYSSFEVKIEAEPQPPTASTDDNAAAGEWTAESFAAATATPTTAAAGSARYTGEDDQFHLHAGDQKNHPAKGK